MSAPTTTARQPSTRRLVAAGVIFRGPRRTLRMTATEQGVSGTLLRTELLGHLAVLLPMALSPQGQLLALRHSVAEFTAPTRTLPRR
ncbi:hypothetical protein [Streptomyces sp. KHY 26]|uniref:hypothetical protein n=1 Tax=Streptomyces sp. KHY 26 TaxID=3097359 RepID=UPI00376EEF06